ncbi:MAG: BatA domain-containing protein [Candidatus Eisenbacteria bacterium]|nr:BatA domain-containing protein [Candidatus Eisenbacteria bacterium]
MPTFLFLNKPFLLGLFAVAIPLLIHLFTRRKARRLDFSTVNFIRDVAKRETKRLRVRNLVLMALRMAAIATFVLAMARPAFVGPFAGGKGSAAVVVVLDNSASMGRLKEGKSLFDYARDAARQLLGSLGDEDEGSVVPVCGALEGVGEGVTESAALVAGPARLVGMVGLVNLSNGSNSPKEALAVANSLLEGSKNINKELYVVSDFQRTRWQLSEVSQPLGGPPQRDRKETDKKQRGQRGIRTILVPIPPSPSDSPAGNLSIEKAGIVPRASTQEQTLEFAVVNHGRSVARGVPVRVMSGGKEIAAKYLDVEPGSSAKVSLRLAAGHNETSAREIDIVLPPDAFPLDNTYFLALEPARQTDVLIVGDGELTPEGKASGEGASRVDFVSLALRPVAAGAPGNLWGFVPHRIASAELDEAELRRAKCVILENVSRLSGRGIDLLREFRDSGGKLLIVLGDRVDIRHYNEKLLPSLFPARLVGVEAALDGQDSFFSLVATIASHPILKGFDVSRGEAVSSARFYRFIRTEGLEGSRVVAEFSHGLPAILEAKGVLLFTGSFEPEWNDLVVSGAFLPMLHEMLRYLCGVGSSSAREFHPGDALEEELPAGQESSLSLVAPSGREPRISKIKLGTSLVLRSEPMNELGIYRLFAGNEEIGTFSVNLDPVESQADPLGKRELISRFPGASMAGEGVRGELAGIARSGQELWPFFLLLCLGFLVAEVLVARSIAPSDRSVHS